MYFTKDEKPSELIRRQARRSLHLASMNTFGNVIRPISMDDARFILKVLFLNGGAENHGVTAM